MQKDRHNNDFRRWTSGSRKKDMQLLEMHMHKAALDLELCAGEDGFAMEHRKLNRDFEFGL